MVWFGPEHNNDPGAFNLFGFGSYNRYVNTNNRRNLERGASEIHIDFGKVNTTRSFKIIIAAEPFTRKEFHDLWEMSFFTLPVFLNGFVANGYV